VTGHTKTGGTQAARQGIRVRFVPAGSRRYRRALDLDVAFGFEAGRMRARAFGAAFFLAAGFFAEGLAFGLVLVFGLVLAFGFGFAAPLGLPATDFVPRGWVSCACAAARRAIGTRNGEHDT
jgi:hypothetical protein